MNIDQQEPTLSQKARCAIRRLHKDWKELDQEKANLSTVTALPTSDIFVWHCNLRPDYGPYAGTIFHLILRFPENYPCSPPSVEFCSHLDHPNVFGSWICLDMIKDHYVSTPYTGWTSAYSILSVLLQLQSFLFAENIPQDWGGYDTASSSEESIGRAVRTAMGFCIEIETHDGTCVKHTHEQPWPPLPKYVGKLGRSSATPVAMEQQHKALVGMTVFVPEAPSAPTLSSAATLLPSDVITNIFSFLDAKELLRVRDVCSRWRRVVFTYNLFERTQIMCYHSKATLDDKNVILGVGLKVEYYPGANALKAVSSPLDLLSLQAFEEEGVRTGVWGGHTENFDHFLPLIINGRHAAKSVPRIEQTVYNIMKNCTLPADKRHSQNHRQFHPYMIFQLVAVLMNSMVVELMNSADPSRTGSGQGHNDTDIQRYASEKALEGYCAFHHMLLYFAKKYPVLIQLADKQLNSFISDEKLRHKRSTPNLGVLVVCLTLSRRGWGSLCKPLVMEAFDRNVRWLLQKSPSLSLPSLSRDERLDRTFNGAKTSLRLMMFQVYFMSRIGRPSNTSGPFDVLDKYEKRMGKPTTAQKEDLQLNAKDILSVSTWEKFFLRLGGQVPTRSRLCDILWQAVANSERKGYHGRQNRGNRGRKTRY